MRDNREFQIVLPDGPYSFSGKLISLVWCLELVVEPGSLCERKEIVISGSGTEVDLTLPVPKQT
jgi:hypothetical protein